MTRGFPRFLLVCRLKYPFHACAYDAVSCMVWFGCQREPVSGLSRFLGTKKGHTVWCGLNFRQGPA